jgi:hypothetical protein
MSNKMKPHLQFKEWVHKNRVHLVQKGIVIADTIESTSLEVPKSGFQVFFDSDFGIGTIAAWESGEIECEIVSVESGERKFWYLKIHWFPETKEPYLAVVE